MKKVIIVLLLGLILIATGTYFYAYQDHEVISDVEAIQSFDSQNLMSIFKDDNVENDKYILGQVIEVSGMATSKDANSITLDNSVFIKLSNPHKARLNETYTIKGRCMGYDDLIEEIKINEGIFIK